MRASRAIYPGSFDPPTLGHQDVLAQAQRIFSNVTVVVARNEAKCGLLEFDERMMLWRRLTKADVVELPEGYSVVEHARLDGAQTIVRGIRNQADLDEAKPFQAFVRTASRAGMDVVYFRPSPIVEHVSSSGVKALLALHDNAHLLAGWLDPRVTGYLIEKNLAR